MGKMLLIPGPSPVHPRILNALAEPTASHVIAEKPPPSRVFGQVAFMAVEETGNIFDYS